MVPKLKRGDYVSKVKELPKEVLENLEACACACGEKIGSGSGY